MQNPTLKSWSVSTSRLLWRLLLAGAQIIVIGALAWTLLRLYPGDSWFVVRMGSYFTPWLLLGVVLALGLALAARRRWLIVAALAAMLLLGGRYSEMMFSTAAPVSADAEAVQQPLRVMSYNINFANQNVAGMTDLIRREKPDIIALQEVTGHIYPKMFEALADEYPHHLLHDETARFAVALLSRYPLTALPTPPEVKRGQQVAVDTPQGRLIVWNIHPGTAVDHGGWQAQRQTLAAIAPHIAATDGPLVLLGDFNTTNQAENYALVAQHLTDAHEAAGRGFGFTFPDASFLESRVDLPWYASLLLAPGPLVRIDHVLVNRYVTPLAAWVIPNGFGSDHRPVLADVRLSN